MFEVWYIATLEIYEKLELSHERVQHLRFIQNPLPGCVKINYTEERVKIK